MSRRAKRRLAESVSPDSPDHLAWLDKPALLLPIILGVASIIRLMFLYAARNDIFSRFLVIDAEFYDQWAQKIAQGDWIGKEVFYQDPLYAYFLALIYKTAGHSLNFVRIVQVIMDLGTVSLIYWIGKNLFDCRAGLIAAAVAAVYGPMIYYTSLLDKTTFTTCLITASLALLCLARKSDRVRNYFLTGLGFGLTALTRGNMVLVGAALALWVFAVDFGKGKLLSFARASSLAGGIVLIVGLITLRNYWVGKDFVPLTANAGLNLAIGNNSGSVGIYMVPPFTHGTPGTEFAESKAYAEYRLGKRLDQPSAVSNFYLREGLSSIAQHPGSWIVLTARKIFLTLHGFEIGETYGYDYFKEKYAVLSMGFVNLYVLGPLGIVGGLWLLLRRRANELHVFSAAYGASLLPFFISSRYRFPLVIPATLFAGWSIASAVSDSRRMLRPQIVGLCIALSIAVLGCSWTPEWMKERVVKPTLSTPHTIAGFLYLDKLSDVKSAIAELERGASIHPAAFTNYLYLANCYLKTGDDEKALENFKQVVRLDPANDEAYEDMGTLFFKHGNYPMALQTFTIALNYKPYEPLYKRNYDVTKALMAHPGRK